MNRKKIWYGWLSSSSAIPIALFIIILNTTLPLVEISLQLEIIGIIAIGYAVSTFFIYRWTRARFEDMVHKPDLDKYSKHLKELMDSLKDHLNTVYDEPTLSDILDHKKPKEKYTDYFSAIKKSKRKIAILQHLLTDAVMEPRDPVSLYNWFTVTQQALKNNKKNFHAGHFRSINDGMIAHFNQEFEHMFLSTYDGQPIFGTCDGCIEFYAGRNYQECRNVLDNTKGQKYKWYYSIFD